MNEIRVIAEEVLTPDEGTRVCGFFTGIARASKRTWYTTDRACRAAERFQACLHCRSIDETARLDVDDFNSIESFLQRMKVLPAFQDR